MTTATLENSVQVDMVVDWIDSSKVSTNYKISESPDAILLQVGISLTKANDFVYAPVFLPPL